MLGEVDFFRDLFDERIDRVVSLRRRLCVSAGQVLGMAGELAHQLFIVIEGKAQLSAHSAIGEITVRIAGPGESFPLAALTGSGTLITSVSAMTDMELLVIPHSRLLALCSDNPVIGMRVYATVADVLGTRYSRTLTHLTAGAEKALKHGGFFANV